MADSVEQQLSNNICYVPVEVVAEVVYVLTKGYNVPRNIVEKTVLDFAEMKNVRVDQNDVVRHAMGVFSTTTLDFVDCLLVGYAKIKQYSIFTFDRKLNRYLNT